MNIKINDFIVPIKDHIKYLGVIIDKKKLNWNEHINYVTTKVTKTALELNRIV